VSRLTMLTTVGRVVGSSGGGGDPDPPDPPDAPQATWPTTSDPVLTALRPAGRVLGVFTVDDRFSVTAANKHNPEPAFEGIFDTEDGLQVADAGANWNLFPQVDVGPDYRGDVIVAQDTYQVAMGSGGWGAMVGAAATRPVDDFGEATILQAANDGTDPDVGGGGIIHSFGSLYLEGITLRSYSVDGHDVAPKYPWHITGGQVMIAAHCTFDITDAVFGVDGQAAGTVGMDGLPGAFVVFYRCKFTKAPGAPGMNLHGSDPGVLPITVCFIECDVTDLGDIGFGASLTLSSGRNKFYVIGCTGLTQITTDGCDVFTDDPDCDFVDNGTGSTITRGTTDWPVPDAGGLPDWWADYYYPSEIDTPHGFTIGMGDAANFTPPAGRQYLVPVASAVTDAIHVTHTGIVAAAAGGEYLTVPKRIFTDPDTDAPDLNLGDFHQNVVNGAQDWQQFQFFTWYPGEADRLYVQATFDGTALVKGSLTAAADALMNDGSGWEPVPGGTRVPVVSVRSST
jgi:hypothetical protein